MISLTEYIFEKALTSEEKAINKLRKNFINNYDNNIGKMLLKHDLCTILTANNVVTQKRAILSSKLWNNMLHRITPWIKDQFDFLKDKDYEFIIPIQLGLKDPSKTNKNIVPKNFFEIENVGIYVYRQDDEPLRWSPVRDDRKRYDCYLFLHLEDLEK